MIAILDNKINIADLHNKDTRNLEKKLTKVEAAYKIKKEAEIIDDIHNIALKEQEDKRIAAKYAEFNANKQYLKEDEPFASETWEKTH